MIIEKLDFNESFSLCEALNIPKELAFQYHQYNGYDSDNEYDSGHTYASYRDRDKSYEYVEKIYDDQQMKVVKPNLAKALLKNSSFQSVAAANEKVEIAILTQDLEILNTALKDPGVDHYQEETNGFSSPLQLACRYGQLEIANLLVNEYGINISAYDLRNACFGGHLDIVKYILDHPDFNPANCDIAFSEAANMGRADVIQYLLSDPRLDPSESDNQAIIIAPYRGNVEIVKLLLAQPRVDPSARSNQAIINAAGRSMEIVKLLLADPRVDPSDQNNQAIINAASKGNVEIVKLLLAQPRVFLLLDAIN